MRSGLTGERSASAARAKARSSCSGVASQAGIHCRAWAAWNSASCEFGFGKRQFGGGNGVLGRGRRPVESALVGVAVVGGVLGRVDRGVRVEGGGEHVQVLRWGVGGVVGLLIGGLGDGLGEGAGLVDQGVGQGVVGDRVAVVAGRGVQQVGQRDAVRQGAVDGGDDGGPVRVAQQALGGGLAEVGGEGGQPVGAQRVGGCAVAVGGQHGGGDAGGDAPPDGGGSVLVGQRGLGGGGAQQGRGISAGAGQGGEVLDQGRPVRVGGAG